MQNKVDTHRKCIALLEAIETFEAFIKNRSESLNGCYISQFPVLVKKYENEIDTYHRCIKRLEQRYNKQLNKLKEL